MPSIDDFKIKRKAFESFRGWDTDIISKLTISGSNSKSNAPDRKESLQNKLEPKSSQNQAKRTSIKSQTYSKSKSNISQLLHPHEPETKSNLSQKIEVAQDNLVDNSFLSLVGLQKKLIIYIYELCKHIGERTTMPLSIENAAMYAETTISAARKALQRLIEKDMVTREKSKAGRGGWTQYGLTTAAYRELKHYDDLNKLKFNYEPNLSQYSANINPEIKPNSPSSSSLNKSTTEESISDNTLSSTLPPEWESIDFSCLEDIGFNKNKLQQIYGAGHLTAEMVQESLYAYDFDRQHNGVKHNNPIGFLMSQLKVKGLPYDLPKNYESPRERAMRRYLEQKQVQRERSQQLHDMLKQESFEEWLSKVSPEEQDKLSPSHAKGTNLRRAALMHHYEKEHWPEKEKTILALVSS